MEMNQRLFDECTVRYKDERQRERAKQKEREESWQTLEQQALTNAEVRGCTCFSAFSGCCNGFPWQLYLIL